MNMEDDAYRGYNVDDTGQVVKIYDHTWNIAICQNFSQKSFRVWKNHMFLTNHMEYRHLFKFQLRIIPSLKKPHVSDEPHGISPIVQIPAQNYSDFEKTTCLSVHKIPAEEGTRSIWI